MGDGDTLRVYGNTNLPEGTAERPLVTFALFAYNQEKYIREAVEGAFSQTYSPLEIILSDDCSTDRTFEIMEEIAKDYRGSHRVVVRRGSTNAGVVSHVLQVSHAASGKLMVMAAGDDISYSHRVSAIVELWIATDADCINSAYDEIDESSQIVNAGIVFPTSCDAQRILASASNARRRNGIVLSAVGFCAAYRTSFWTTLPPLTSRLMVEDGLATCLLNLRGQIIEFVNMPLLAYRIHSRSLSLRDSNGSLESEIRREERIRTAAREVVARTKYIEDVLGRDAITDVCSELRGLYEEERFALNVIGLEGRSFPSRLWCLLKIRKIRELKFFLPRLGGVRLLAVMRGIARYFH